MLTKLLQRASVCLAVFACIAACSSDETSTAGSGSSTASSGAGGDGGGDGGGGDAASLCGNDIVDTDDEQCDGGGESANCNSDCTNSKCGDGKHNVAAGEACDDGNLEEGDACSSTCEVTPFVIAEKGKYPQSRLPAFAVVAQPLEERDRFVVVNESFSTFPNTIQVDESTAFVEYRGYALSGKQELPTTSLSTTAGSSRFGTAVNADGRILVAWSSMDGGIRMHPIDTQGKVVGKNDQPVGDKTVAVTPSRVAVASVSDGSFCILWKELPEEAKVASNALRCLNSLGTGFIAETVAFGEVDSNVYSRPELMRAGENVVAVWYDFSEKNIYGRAWSTTGTEMSQPFIVAALGPTNTMSPDRIVGSGHQVDGFLVGYSHVDQGIGGKLYEGIVKSPTPFDLAPSSSKAATLGDLVTASDGRILMLWQPLGTFGAVRLDVFAADGKPIGSIAEVNTSSKKIGREHLRLAVTRGGAVMAVWTEAGPPSYVLRGMGVIHPRLLKQLTP